MFIIRKIRAAIGWLLGEAWERVNVVGTARGLVKMAKEQGLRFAIAAGIWEAIESLVIPGYFIARKQPLLAALFVVFHLEPIVYPVLIYGFRTWDRLLGRIPWEPDRAAMSSSFRSGAKVTLYRLASFVLFLGVFSQVRMSQWVLGAYTVLMALFGYVHERMWHDVGWGISADDQVETRRIVAKALTYRVVSAVLMLGVLKGVLGAVPWAAAACYQALALVLFAGLEALWARSSWGIQPTVPSLEEILRRHPEDEEAARALVRAYNAPGRNSAQLERLGLRGAEHGLLALGGGAFCDALWIVRSRRTGLPVLNLGM